MYLEEYEYYTISGKDGEINFPRLEYRARKLIDRYSQGRVARMKTVPEAVKYCMVELINSMDAQDPTDVATSPALSGYTNDGYSESYAAPVTKESLDAAFYGIIREYLSDERDDEGTPLLYLGVD